jgi:hypothetical protein
MPTSRGRHAAATPCSRAEARARARLGRRRREARLEALESRALTALIGFDAEAFPRVIHPRAGLVSVLITGTARVEGGGRPQVNFQLVDEYREHQTDQQGPVGPVGVRTSPVAGTPGLYGFRFRIRVPAQVHGSDLDGRQFALTVAARHGKNAAGTTFPILIPNPNGPRPKPPLSASAQAAMAQAARQMARRG